MERKIGEIFEHNGEWYQCVNTGFSCVDCDIKGDCSDIAIGSCSSSLRTDGKKVIFKKLEKVGKPVEYDGDCYQGFKAADSTITEVCQVCAFNDISCGEAVECDKGIFFIRIKQNQEDMEEKKLSLKPFDLEAAKAGKPVCTRDGRKARIICFDRKNNSEPIVALIDNKGYELNLNYNVNGRCQGDEESCLDLMISEKHEGWVNIYNHGNNDTYVSNMIFATEELAKEAVKRMNGEYIATVKIQWKE